MKTGYLPLIPLIILFFLLTGCQEKSTDEKESAVGADGWLSGTTDEKLDEVSQQLGGFSHTMVEVGYRFSELYWAGQDENWEYADHQIEHLLEAMENGLKRRPARAASSEEFMNQTLPGLKRLVEQQDKDAFLEGFKTLTAACNQCHSLEGEGFIIIREPEIRLSPVRF